MNKTNKPTVAKVFALVKTYYAKPDNASGGSLHIVLEDGNIESNHVAWCMEYAAENNDPYGVVLADFILQLSLTQREKLVERVAHEIWY